MTKIKKQAKWLIGLLFFCVLQLNAQTVLFTDSFESYSNGEDLLNQTPDIYDIWGAGTTWEVSTNTAQGNA